MIVDRVSAAVVIGLPTADVVIVGAGTVGLLVANALIEKGFTVLVIETGDRVATTMTDGFGADSSEKPHDGVRLGRAFGLGGTSTLWGGQLVELEPCDLIQAPHQWPITFSELYRYYLRTYAALGMAEKRTDQQYRAIFGIDDCDAITHSDVDLEQFFTGWLPQPNFSALLRDLINSNPKLYVLLNTTAVDTVFNGNQCQALSIITAAGEKHEIKGKHFVFCAGTVANAQFFLSTQLSGETPWTKNSYVGAYFQDHLGMKIGELDIVDESKFRRYFENGIAYGRKLQPKLRFSAGARANVASGVTGMVGFRSLKSGQIAEAKQLIRSIRSGLTHAQFWTLPNSLIRLTTSLAPLVIRYLKNRRILARFDQGVDFLIQAEQLPTALSKIELVPGFYNKAGLCKVRVHWQLDGRELQSIRAFVRAAEVFFTRTGIGTLRPSELLKESDEVLSKHLADTYHQCGGLRMGAGPEVSVTDANCKVWGSNNVYVGGASVFPASGHANCTLTALALGIRLADHLEKRLQE